MPDGISIDTHSFRTMLKWHRGHKQAGDISFTPERIAEGMARGASVEIDLVYHAGGGMAVLHDELLDKATTGTGPVRGTTADQLRQLFLRDRNGAPSPHRIMLIEDLGHLMANSPCGEGAVLQLDLKETVEDMTEADITAFAAAIAPVRDKVILSAGDASAVARLAAAIPGLPVGYDPCHDGAIERVLASGDFTGFVEAALQAMPEAQTIYLHHQLVLAAEERGFDLIAAFHAAEKRIDAYTINEANPDSLAKVLRLLALRCDQITTDDPVGLEQLVLQSRGE